MKSRVNLGLGLLVLVVVAGGVVPADAGGTKRLRGDLASTFFFHPCSDDAPPRAQCLHDDVAGKLGHLGTSIGSFDVVLDIARFGKGGCGPISRKGSFIVASGDRLDVEASGTFCAKTFVASYEYRITGGSGQFVGASGIGQWVVPAPASFDGIGSGIGNETLTGSLVMLRPESATGAAAPDRGREACGPLERAAERRF
jgi:hypothetical protein